MVTSTTRQKKPVLRSVSFPPFPSFSFLQSQEFETGVRGLPARRERTLLLQWRVGPSPPLGTSQCRWKGSPSCHVQSSGSAWQTAPPPQPDRHRGSGVDSGRPVALPVEHRSHATARAHASPSKQCHLFPHLGGAPCLVQIPRHHVPALFNEMRICRARPHFSSHQFSNNGLPNPWVG